MTAGVETVPCTADQARVLTDRIKVSVEGVWHLVTEAYTSRVWSVLGYSSWDDYCTREFGTSRLRLPREDRVETVQSLRASGLSLRAIESATGHSQHTIIRDLRTKSEVLQSAAPAGAVLEPADALAQRIANELDAADKTYAEQAAAVIGIDGKTYAPTRPRAQQAPRTDVPREPGPADAIAEAMRAPSVVMGRTIARLELVIQAGQSFDMDEAVSDLGAGQEVNAANWLATLEIAIPLLETWRGALRRRNLRSVK